MKSKLALLTVIFLGIIVLLTHPANPAAYLSADPLSDLIKVAIALVATLLGIPAFLAASLTLLEYAGKLTESDADRIQMYTNTALYLASLIAVLAGRTDLLLMLDRYLGGISPILAAILLMLTGGAFSIIQTAGFMQKLRRTGPIRFKGLDRLVESFPTE